jgi:hypothetical protein
LCVPRVSWSGRRLPGKSMGWDPLVLEEVVGRAPAVRMSEAQLSALADELAGMR